MIGSSWQQIIEQRLRELETAVIFDTDDLSSGGALVLPNGDLYIGNVSNVATAVAMSGDVTIGNTGITAIGALKVINAMIANSTIDLTAKVTGALPIANGGTGQTTATLGFNALSPATTRGDIIVRDATNNVRLALGTVGKILRSDGTDLGYSTATYPNTFVAGDLLTATATNVVGVVTAVAAGQPLLSGGAGVVPAYAGYTFTGTAGGTTSFAVTNTKTLTLTATDNFNLTIPATGTAALLGTANVFTTTQQITVATATTTGLILKTSDYNSTKNLLEIQDNTAYAIFNVTGKGNINSAISNTLTGAAANDRAFGMTFNITSDGTTTGRFPVGFFSQVTTQGATNFATASAATITGLFGGVSLSGLTTGISVGLAGRVVIGNASTVSAQSTGLRGIVLWNALGTVTSAIGVESFMSAGNANVNATSAYLFKGTVDALATVTNLYGLYLPALAGAGTINSAITTLGGTINLTHNADSVFVTMTGHTTLATATSILKVIRNDTATGISRMLSLVGLGSGSDGDGIKFRMAAKDSTTADMDQFDIQSSWATSPAGGATHLSRKALATLNIWDTASREFMRAQSNGSAAMISFFAAAAVVQQTGCAVPTDLATAITAITALRTALNNYGLTTAV